MTRSARPRRQNPKFRFVVHRVKLSNGGNKILTCGGSAGIIKGISVDFTSSNASGVVNVRETSSTGVVLFTANGSDTDTTNASTGEILVPCTDGLNVSNSGITNPVGIHFAQGLYVSYASATAGDTVVVRILVDTRVVYVVETLKLIGSNGSAAASYAFYMHRPGILRAIRVGASAASTCDFTIKVDADNNGSNAGATVFTATNFGTSPIVSASTAGTPASVCVGGLDEANGAVTSPSGGGIPFMHGLTCAFAQGNSNETIKVEYWIEY